ncbi:uncharacterized protein LOC123530235 [Mercenaria mercenaria]|uniref:uncharacterized protein LOC123530235 n=1 Tax=Mercenaria mercenaria TaxID=6596 RepID=UPI00234EF7A9|nr:uncharacterized protein LOC123530235 [Mercenaria mercenaria]
MGSGYYKGKTERFWVPALPMPAAITCCVLNFLIPGLGTAIAGLFMLCFGRTEDMEQSSKGISCLANCGIGFLQLVVTLAMFIGWCWSCYWGILFIMMSVEYYHNNKVDDDDRINVAPTTSVVTTTVITQQPFQPFQVAQPGTQPGPHVTTRQPVAPPPYQGTSSVGINPSGSALYPDPPTVRYADGSEQKLAV